MVDDPETGRDSWARTCRSRNTGDPSYHNTQTLTGYSQRQTYALIIQKSQRDICVLCALYKISPLVHYTVFECEVFRERIIYRTMYRGQPLVILLVVRLSYRKKRPFSKPLHVRKKNRKWKKEVGGTSECTWRERGIKWVQPYQISFFQWIWINLLEQWKTSSMECHRALHHLDTFSFVSRELNEFYTQAALKVV